MSILIFQSVGFLVVLLTQPFHIKHMLYLVSVVMVTMGVRASAYLARHTRNHSNRYGQVNSPPRLNLHFLLGVLGSVETLRPKLPPDLHCFTNARSTPNAGRRSWACIASGARYSTCIAQTNPTGPLVDIASGANVGHFLGNPGFSVTVSVLGIPVTHFAVGGITKSWL